jgi:hypothetical protein
MNSNQIQLSASSRGITDHFFCFACDQHVLDCDHLVDDRLADAERFFALEPSPLQSLAYSGKLRILEVAYKASIPFIHGEVPLPAPPGVLHFFDVPRYSKVKENHKQFRCLMLCASAPTAPHPLHSISPPSSATRFGARTFSRVSFIAATMIRRLCCASGENVNRCSSKAKRRTFRASFHL